MAKSMTGYGRGQQIIDNYTIMVEIKSVNHRYTDFNFRVPRHYGFLEEKIKSYLKDYISRGKIDVLISVHKNVDDSKEISLNTALAKGYIDALESIADEFGLENDIKVSTVAQYTDIFEVTHKEDDEEDLLKLVLAVTEEAAGGFSVMRLREGEKLAADMLARNSHIRESLKGIAQEAPKTVTEQRERIEQRIRELIGDVPVDENRLLTEVAIFADKICIAEEITRLNSHLDEFDRIAVLDEPVGRKLEFLLQEMNREINTIGSKASNINISRSVVNIKSELEKIREQLQNIE